MTLEDFEKQLVQEKQEEEKKRERRHHHRHDHGEDSSSHRRRDRDRDNHHGHRHRSHRDREHDDEQHRSKRRRREEHDDGKRERDHDHKHRHRHSRRRSSASVQGGEGIHDTQSKPEVNRPQPNELKRDSWMEAPSALDVDYIHRKRKEPSPPKQGSLGAEFEIKIHEKELNQHLRDLKNGKEKENEELQDTPTSREVEYTFGDAGSSWRMTRLRAVYRQAEEKGQKMEEVALERYDSLRDFDEAREEEIEMDRRKTYGKGYVGKEKPSGELYQQRKLDAGVHKSSTKHTGDDDDDDVSELGDAVEGVAVPAPTTSAVKVDQTVLNKLKAQLMKAQLRKDPRAEDMQKEYDDAVAAFQMQDPTVVTLSAMDNRMLSSAPRNEVKSVSNRRGAERGQVEENEEMSIEDMVREERRTRGQGGGEGQQFAERIAKDGKFDNDLEYMEENANKLAKRVQKSDINLRNVAVNEYQKLNKILENCPLCHHEDTDTPPVAPVVSLATRTYLTLPTEPELAPYAAMIVPTQHHTNLLETDDDEWEEIRNFMKSLTRLYHEQGSDVIFYENAAHTQRRPHAAMVAVPLPYSLGETAPAFFKEAFLTTESEWSQHKKIIDTLAKSRAVGGPGRLAFRRSLVKEMPYFHVWFEMDGGIGHVVEEVERWPRGDLFARQIIGGMLGLEPDVIRRQGRWYRGHDEAQKKRVDAFKKRWRKFDWTRILTEQA